MPYIADRVKDTTTSTGTTAITLASSPPTGYQSFATGFGASTVSMVGYCIDDGAGNWEVGKGYFNSVGDPYWSNVKVLLHGDGTNGGTTFTDSSTIARTCTPTAGVTTSSTQVKFGTTSMFMNSVGNGLQWPNAADMAFAGDFTVDFWCYAATIAAGAQLFANLSSGGLQIGQNAGSLGVARQGLAWDLTSSTAIPTSQWNYIEVGRQGTTMYIFLNGALIASGAVASSYTTGAVCTLSPASGVWTGYIDDFRITQNVCRHTLAYSVPTTAAPDAVTIPQTLTREIVRSSSNNNSLVNFGAGTKTVFCTASAELLDNANVGQIYAQVRSWPMP